MDRMSKAERDAMYAAAHDAYGPMFSLDTLKRRLKALGSGALDSASLGLATPMMEGTDAGADLAGASSAHPAAWAKGFVLGMPLAPIGAVTKGLGAIGRTLAARPVATGGTLATLGATSPNELNTGENDMVELIRMLDGYETGGRVKKKKEAQSATPAVDPLFEKVKGNPGLEAMYYAMKDREAAGARNIEGVLPASSDKARETAAADARELRQKIIEQLMRDNPQKKEFSKAFPGLSQAWPLVQAGVGAATGAATRGISTKLHNAALRPWIETVRKAEDAIQPKGLLSRVRSPNPAEAHRQTQIAKEMMAQHNKPAGFLKKAGHALDEIAPAAVGAVTAVEANALKHRYNLDNAPQDSQEYKDARQALGPEAGSNAAMSALWGGLGGLSGGHFANLYARKAAPVAQTQALLSRYAPEYADDAKAFGRSIIADQNLGALSKRVPELPKKVAAPSNRADIPELPPVRPAQADPLDPLDAGRNPSPAQTGSQSGSQSLYKRQTFPNDVPQKFAAYDQQTHGVIARQYLDELLTKGQGGTKALPIDGAQMAAELERRFVAAGLPPVEPADLFSRISASRSIVGDGDRLLRDPSIRRSANQPAVRQGVLDTALGKYGTLGVTGAAALGAAGMGDARTARQELEEVLANGGLLRTPSPSLLDGAHETDTYARGGAVDRTHHGPLHSSVAGRTDHLPITVNAGSYVIPADIVSALGEGNTTAGLEVIQGMFPKIERPNLDFAAGGKVPIMAAGGEYVLSPDHVAAVGKGDLKAGHEILDAWVKKMRAKTIDTLKRLPGPAR